MAISQSASAVLKQFTNSAQFRELLLQQFAEDEQFALATLQEWAENEQFRKVLLQRFPQSRLFKDRTKLVKLEEFADTISIYSPISAIQ